MINAKKEPNKGTYTDILKGINQAIEYEKGNLMCKSSVKMSEVKEILMTDIEFRAEYEKLKPRYDIISQIIEARVC